jgi:predicted nucleic acid-binding protein
MPVLVDTSIWVDYFRSGSNSEQLDFLIDENLVVTNDLILAELIPFLRIHHQQKIIVLLRNIQRLDLRINWDQIIEYQYKCLKNGLNGIGIPDLIIAQNAKQNDSEIYSLDNHFILMKEVLNIRVQINDSPNIGTE